MYFRWKEVTAIPLLDFVLLWCTAVEKSFQGTITARGEEGGGGFVDKQNMLILISSNTSPPLLSWIFSLSAPVSVGLGG